MNAFDVFSGSCGGVLAVLQSCSVGVGRPTCGCQSPLAPAASAEQVITALGWTRHERADGVAFERSGQPPAAVTVAGDAGQPTLWLDVAEVVTPELAQELVIALLAASAAARSRQESL